MKTLLRPRSGKTEERPLEPYVSADCATSQPETGMSFSVIGPDRSGLLRCDQTPPKGFVHLMLLTGVGNADAPFLTYRPLYGRSFEKKWRPRDVSYE
jgi:hypothetical protein